MGGSLWAASDEQAAYNRQRKAPHASGSVSEAADASEPLAAAALRQVPIVSNFRLLHLAVSGVLHAAALRCATLAAKCHSQGSQKASKRLHSSKIPQSLHSVQDSISPRLRRSTSEERGSGTAAGATSSTAGGPEASKHSGSGADDGDVMYVTSRGAVAYLFVASAVLVALFFLLDYINTLIVRFSLHNVSTSDQQCSAQWSVVCGCSNDDGVGSSPLCQFAKCTQHMPSWCPCRRWCYSASAPSRPSLRCCGWRCAQWRPARCRSAQETVALAESLTLVLN